MKQPSQSPRHAAKQPPAQRIQLRSLACSLLLQWSHGQRHATDLIDEACRFRQVQGPDRAFLQDLVLSTLRHLSLLDHWIAQLCPNPKLDHRTRWLLRLGL